MKRDLVISVVYGREILDSRGFPTVKAYVELEGGASGVASVPSGASTGAFEAHELRDNDPGRYGGKGVLKAVENINNSIAPVIIGMDAQHQDRIDKTLIALDGTENKEKLGANAILAVSLATARAAAKAFRMPLYRHLSDAAAHLMPVPLMNILNGGAHASNNIDIQEFMIAPVGADCFSEALRWGSEVYHVLGSLLHESGYSTAVGDEGGFAPDLESDEQAIEWIIKAIKKAGYKTTDIGIAIDAASSEWVQGDRYVLPKKGIQYDSRQLISYWKNLCDAYPILSIEDGMGENDWDGWVRLTKSLKTQLVGDDLFVTNAKRLERGIEIGAANSILIKVNQIGTLTETMDAIGMAKAAGYTTIISHRSGETEDTSIADLAVAVGSGQIKTGAPCRSERVAKYNRLLCIEEELGETSRYSGKQMYKSSQG